uniref:Uncharacterized protein n=1 Tax=Geospiza parvula TaxID=87175 RepID=A0A8C3NAS2_GEOPR
MAPTCPGGSGDASGSLIPIFPGTALGSWGVSYPESLQASGGSCLVVPCTFSYPTDVTTADGIVAIWYKDYDGQRAVVFHSAAPQDVDSRFGGRAQLLGDPMARNCTLLLRGVTPGDSGLYRFRFEIINGDRWSASRDVTLSRPSVASSEEQTEGQRSTLECSTPYFCPRGDTVLRWEGYDPQVSQVSSHVQLDTSGVSHQVTLTSSFTWKDHSKKLLCVVSDGSKRASAEVVLRVRHAPQEPSFVALVEPRGGRQAVLLCSADGVPPPAIAVSRGQGHPPLATSLGPSDPRFEVRATPTSLRVGMAGLEPGDAGLYVCSATNSRGSATASLHLQVPGEVSPRPQGAKVRRCPRGHCWSPRCRSSGVTLTVEPSQEVAEGTKATMSCSATAWGDKGVNYTWYRDGRWLWEGPSGSFVLSPVTFLENQNGHRAIVLCTAQSHPPSSLALLHHGHLLATSLSPAVPPGVRATPSHNTLRVELVALGTAAGGRYVCMATNALGNATASADFDVHSEWGRRESQKNPRNWEMEWEQTAKYEGGTCGCVGDIW